MSWENGDRGGAETLGVILFQEQMIKVARDLQGAMHLVEAPGGRGRLSRPSA